MTSDGSLFYLFLRVALGVIFVVAAVAKIVSPREFSKAVSNFRIFSPRLSPAIGHTIAAMELVGGAALLFGLFEWLGGILIAGLLLAFNAAMAANLIRGRRHLDCRCFGRSTVRIGWGHVAQNTVLLVACLAIAVWGPDDPASPEYLTATSVVTVLAGVYTGIAFIAAQELISVGARLDLLFDFRPRGAE